jgi:putative colanic acid biosynthesis UDP-glucose lipid carrier transferase
VEYNIIAEAKHDQHRATVSGASTHYRSKRTFDVLFSTMLLLISMPTLFPVLILLILSDLKGGPFFLQERNGQHNKIFRCIKFRTMTNEMPAAERKITKVGRWLRLSGLDELPQLFNVLKGDMSLIGPRPHMISDNQKFEKMVPFYNRRHLIRPGITGLAQSIGHKGIIHKRQDILIRVKYDLIYIRRQSLWLDLKIIRNTIVRMFLEIFRPCSKNL